MDINTFISQVLQFNPLTLVLILTLFVELIIKPLTIKIWGEDLKDILVPIFALVFGFLVTIFYVYGGDFAKYTFTGLIFGLASIGAYKLPIVNNLITGTKEVVYGVFSKK